MQVRAPNCCTTVYKGRAGDVYIKFIRLSDNHEYTSDGDDQPLAIGFCSWLLPHLHPHPGGSTMTVIASDGGYCPSTLVKILLGEDLLFMGGTLKKQSRNNFTENVLGRIQENSTFLT
jgi:hypothetical protein